MALLGETHQSLKNLFNHAELALLEASRTSNSTTQRPPENPGILETDLVALTNEERLAFQIIMGTLCILSLCGNLSTLYVNSRRKMRPFFRTCLISLALSDLLNTIFLTLTHFPQFIAEYVQIWLLGSVLCRFIPQVTTAAILASSMTLVGIALDRYFAVMKAVVSYWNPGVGFCFVFAFGIWIAAFGIAIPLCFIYHTLTVWILSEVDFPDEGVVTTTTSTTSSLQMGKLETLPFYTLFEPTRLVTMCVSEQKDVALYYVIVFSIIFVPCIVAFVWLNAIIAKKIWTRRHRVPQQRTEQMTVNYPKQNEDYIEDPFKSGYVTDSTTKRKPPAGYSSAREARHIRMFIVILVLMAVFIVCRLPAWIFLVMRMYGSYTKPHDWIIYFSFGVLNLASSALNPLFYTFMPETLQYISCCKRTICPKRDEYPKKCIAQRCLTTPQCQSDIPCCICCGLMCCFPTAQKCNCASEQSGSFSQGDIKLPRPLSFELDEGVDCCDASYEEDEQDEEDDQKRSHQEICINFSANLPATYNQQQRY